eukprot:CAMPEP_0197632988 /NCGR_PEP_ID=MMETSP1338-20131121/9471_1 /TAXON_ID=43686 ORGANISM="Pelagodinium beii, Strain RCC1491" /NCGR_SAMPLE_ID=MMETSP1338 /ASSEMBLY_ACC=CAM_ASM_000754 /LENGTH=282 /DNA_ID=CAMNT_0043204567 /DNA_START=86 /DNA_END=934 /DNA_ORIENTATION=-
MSVFKLCFAWLAACSLRCAGANCELPNGFKKTECGSANATLGLQCCTSREACIEVEDTDGVIHGKCSAARSLDGHKAVHVVLIPLIGFVTSTLAAVYMVRYLMVKSSRVTQLCLAQLCLSWPLYLTMYSPMGFYAVFLSVLTSYCCLWKGAIGWLYRAVWIMQIFNVIAYFGAYEAFHVPLFGLSGAYSGESSVRFINSETVCSSYYGEYFQLLDLERTTAKEANPAVFHYGLCSVGWLGFAQVMWMLQGLHWAVTCGVCMPVLTKVDPAVDTNFADLKVAP